MNKALLVACALAGGLFAAFAGPPPAQAFPSINLNVEKNANAVTPVARRGGGGFRGGRGMGGRSFGRGRGGGFRGGRASRGRVYGGRRGVRSRGYRRGRVYGYRGYGGRRYRGRRYRRGRVYGYYYGGGYYGGGCAWLRRRASATGSAYWWSRYNRCVRYYY